VGQDTAESDGGPNKGVELLVATDGELEMAGGDALDFEILGGVLWEQTVSLTSIEERAQSCLECGWRER